MLLNNTLPRMIVQVYLITYKTIKRETKISTCKQEVLVKQLFFRLGKYKSFRQNEYVLHAETLQINV